MTALILLELLVSQLACLAERASVGVSAGLNPVEYRTAIKFEPVRQ